MALINDYEVVLAGLSQMLSRYRSRIEVVEIHARTRVTVPVDVALYDTFGQPEDDAAEVRRLAGNPRNRHIALYTWKVDQDLIDSALAAGARGFLAKSMAAVELVDALERIAHGETVVSAPQQRIRPAPAVEWPGRSIGISDRESEILALITQGKRNIEIASLTHLSVNTVKTHIRSLYGKIEAENRVDAVIWGTQHGFQPDHRSIDLWMGEKD
ncbi:DNA-binding response regulator [Frondihabitans sp. PAMC 28766]|uniref:response regulator transcription factor n=1 Tax=Frondihabitans sp. PAMC 28766 TaxID=1795630 RepID=UPI00269F465B